MFGQILILRDREKSLEYSSDTFIKIVGETFNYDFGIILQNIARFEF